MNFEIGHTYSDTAGNKYTLLSRDGDYATFRFNRSPRAYRIIRYCGVEAVIQYGKVLFKCGEIRPTEDPEIDMPKQPQVYKINLNNERYIDVLKSHIE